MGQEERTEEWKREGCHGPWRYWRVGGGGGVHGGTAIWGLRIRWVIGGPKCTWRLARLGGCGRNGCIENDHPSNKKNDH